jgi:EpsI family protein
MRVRRLVAQLDSRTEPITYWMVIGERVTITGTETKLAQLSYGLRGQIPDGILMRVSSIDRDSAAAFELQQRFIAQLARAVPPASQTMAFGQHAH